MNYSRKGSDLKIASHNIVSLRIYKDKLEIILNDNEIDVMAEMRNDYMERFMIVSS